MSNLHDKLIKLKQNNLLREWEYIPCFSKIKNYSDDIILYPSSKDIHSKMLQELVDYNETNLEKIPNLFSLFNSKRNIYLYVYNNMKNQYPTEAFPIFNIKKKYYYLIRGLMFIEDIYNLKVSSLDFSLVMDISYLGTSQNNSRDVGLGGSEYIKT